MTTRSRPDPEIVEAAVAAYFRSRTVVTTPVSAERALRSVRRIVGYGPSDRELLDAIAAHARAAGTPLDTQEPG